MPRMKHILRKLHIGGENTRPVIVNSATDPPPQSSSTPSSDSSALSTMAAVRIGGVDPITDRTVAAVSQENSSSSGGVAGTGGDLDFNLLEEEFQVQLALAISVSDPSPKTREDTESVQIKVAKRMSLGYSPSAAAEDSETLVEFLSLRYWNYNFVNYDEKVMDGFYDVYEITSNSISQRKMPLLVDLKAISVMDNLDYDVVLVNRFIDHDLRLLEDKADCISLECQVSGKNSLIQQLADLVVERMGGAVGDADEIWKRWTFRSNELRRSLDSIVIPLGCLDVGLSRHRALLFKVLADRINFPCMLVKGSYYTGTDEGAVNLIKFDDGSEYIIDLMGAPGTLIPPEVPCGHLPNSGLDKRCLADNTEILNDSFFGFDKGALSIAPDLGNDSLIVSSMSEEASCISIQTDEVNKNLTKKRETAKFEHEFGMLLPILPQLTDVPAGTSEKVSSAQKIKVKDVSKYVISAAKNPEFAQKLHAVLLESGASPPADLFSDINFQDIGKQNIPDKVKLVDEKGNDGANPQLDNVLSSNEQSLRSSTVQSDTTNEGFVMISGESNETIQADDTCVMVLANSSRTSTGTPYVNQIHELSLPPAVDSRQKESFIPPLVANDTYFQHIVDKTLNKTETDREPVASFIESNNTRLMTSNSQSERNPLLGEVAEWEISWNDLQVAERIGIGSYGEVYHADWNGTEVAVKKFLVQDFTGDTLDQFKCEIEIMLRLRHPNVVLFMGAVTRPPNLSILTEFIPRGSLYRLLHRPNHHLDEKRRLRMALDVAKGMNYLHTSHPPIVHRDLKSPNLLVDKNWVVKVCDFGLSRLKHHTFLSSKSTAGTPEWMAPEVLRNERSSEKCDVYSFGVILWELATSLVPWSGMNPMQVVGAVGFQNRRLDIPEDVDPLVAQIIHDCWQNDPQLRPNFAQLIHRLRRVPRLYNKKTESTSQRTE